MPSRASRPRRARRLALVAGAACLALPALAQADSIVYVDGGNVWSATPDGARKVQLTDGGGWHSPTQADDGTIAAVKGTGLGIQVMAPDGRPLYTIATPSARSGNGDTFATNPVQLSFSPDGSKIAYSYVQASCVVASTCGSAPQTATLVTDAKGPTGSPTAQYGYTMGLANPEWLTNTRLVGFGGFGIDGALVDVPGADNARKPWILDNEDVGDGEVSRDGKRFVITNDYGSNLHLVFGLTNGDPRTDATAQPVQISCTSDNDPSVADPSFSPDGSAVAFQESDGIKVFRFRSVVANDCDLESSTLVLPGAATEPDWGPANPPAARYQAAPVPGPAPAPAPATPGAKRVVKLVGARKVSAKALRRGLTVKVQAPAAGTVSAKLRLGRKTVARGSAKAKAAGPVRLRLGKVKRVARHRKLTLVVTQAGATAAKATLKVR